MTERDTSHEKLIKCQRCHRYISINLSMSKFKQNAAINECYTAIIIIIIIIIIVK